MHSLLMILCSVEFRRASSALAETEISNVVAKYLLKLVLIFFL